MWWSNKSNFPLYSGTISPKWLKSPITISHEAVNYQQKSDEHLLRNAFTWVLTGSLSEGYVQTVYVNYKELIGIWGCLKVSQYKDMQRMCWGLFTRTDSFYPILVFTLVRSSAKRTKIVTVCHKVLYEGCFKSHCWYFFSHHLVALANRNLNVCVVLLKHSIKIARVSDHILCALLRFKHGITISNVWKMRASICHLFFMCKRRNHGRNSLSAVRDLWT